MKTASCPAFIARAGDMEKAGQRPCAEVGKSARAIHMRIFYHRRKACMENAIRRLDGVQSAAVSFMAQKLVLEADDTRFDEVFKQVVKACKKVEPDLVIQA